MGWRTVAVTKQAKLDYSMGYMVVRDAENTVKIHIDEISLLIIENTATSVTTALLSKLTASKVKVIFCDEKRNPSSELVSYYGSYDCSKAIKELSCLFDSIVMKHFRVLLIEPQTFSFNKKTSMHIIDSDLCCIDNDEII